VTKTIVIADLDTPCYAAAAVCDNRSVLVKHEPTGKTKVFKNRTEFKNLLKSKGKSNFEEYSFEDIQEPEPVENACHTLKMGINRILEAIQPDEVIYVISGSSNFRDNLPLPTKYKSSRADMLRPALLGDVREFVKKKYKPLVAQNEEADDMQVYLGYEELYKGNKPIAVSIDKDILAYSGLFVLNQDKLEEGIQEIPQLGYLEIDAKNKVRGKGFLWYCLQHIVGDITDGYKPTDLAGVKFGEKSAYKLLVNCKTEQEALLVVKDMYKQWYPDTFTYKDWQGVEHEANYKSILDLYFKCCRMKSHEFDELNSEEFFAKYGVEL